MKKTQVISVLAIAASMALLGAGCVAETAVDVGRTDVVVEKTNDVRAGWQTYTDRSNRFSFQHPVGTYVMADATGDKLTILGAPVEDTPVPDMTISITDGDIHFDMWEDFDIPYFKDLVSSFKYN